MLSFHFIRPHSTSTDCLWLQACLGFVVDCGPAETRSRDFVLVDMMLKFGLLLGSSAGGEIIEKACPCLKGVSRCAQSAIACEFSV